MPEQKNNNLKEKTTKTEYTKGSFGQVS